MTPTVRHTSQGVARHCCTVTRNSNDEMVFTDPSWFLPPKPITFAENERIAGMLRQGMLPAVIARETGRSVETIVRLRTALRRVAI